MPLWEGILASFCAGLAISLINRFGLSQVRTPCEKRLQAKKKRWSDSSSSDESHAGATSAATAEIHVHSHGE